ncbi:hypothetical protein ACFQX6_22445 [Streptosporangium lutulentum]
MFAEVRAPEAGTPLFLTTSPAVSADGLLLGLAREPHTGPRQGPFEFQDHRGCGLFRVVPSGPGGRTTGRVVTSQTMSGPWSGPVRRRRTGPDPGFDGVRRRSRTGDPRRDPPEEDGRFRSRATAGVSQNPVAREGALRRAVQSDFSRSSRVAER